MIATMLITLILRVAILECLVFVYLEVIKMTESLQNQDDVLNEIEIVLIGTKKGTGIHGTHTSKDAYCHRKKNP